MGARAKIATVTTAETHSTATLMTRGPMPAQTTAPGGSLPEPFPLRFEQLVACQTAGEAQKAGVGDHPVRRPHAPASHSPAALQELEGLQHPEPPQLAQAVEETLDLAHVRAVGEDDPTRPQRLLGDRRRLPWLREVQQDSVHVPLLYPGVDVAQLQGQVRRDLAHGLDDRPLRGFEELLPRFVADDRSGRADGAKSRHRQRAGARARLHNARTRMDVGADQDRPQVLRVDRLRLAAASSHLLGESRADREQAGAELSRDHGSLGLADQVVVLDEPGMDRVALAGAQADSVPPSHLVDEEDELALGEVPHGLWARIRACQYACHSLPSRRSGLSCFRAWPSADSIKVASSAARAGLTAMFPIHSS